MCVGRFPLVYVFLVCSYTNNRINRVSQITEVNKANFLDITMELSDSIRNFTNKRVFFKLYKDLFDAVNRSLAPVTPENANLTIRFCQVGNISYYLLQLTHLGRVRLGLFWNRITRNRWYSCSFESYSVSGMNGISFRSFCFR